MKSIFILIAAILLFALPADAQRKYYGGGRHTTSHGGHYSGGQGSSHKGGHYKNAGTNNHYGRHKR